MVCFIIMAYQVVSVTNVEKAKAMFVINKFKKSVLACRFLAM